MRALRDALACAEENTAVRAVIFVLVLALIGGVMGLLNAHTPLQMDDYDYSISWHTGQPLTGLADVLASQAAHYRLWGGRTLVHAIAQAFLTTEKVVFNVANTLMYLLLLLELYTLARPRGRRFCWALLLGAHLFCFTCVPFFGTVFLWLDGACNYLWGTVIALTPLLICRSACGGGFFARRAALPLAVLVGIAAGWTNENTACGVAALMLIACALVYRRTRRLPAALPCTLVGQGIGLACMLLAPGNFARAGKYAAASLPLELLRRLVSITFYGAVYAGGLLVALLLLGALARALGVQPRKAQIGLLTLGALAAAYAMVASPELSDRALTGVLMLLLAACMTVAGDLEERVRGFDAAKLAALPLVLLLTAYAGYQALGDVRAHETAWRAQVQTIEQAAAAGESSVRVQSVPSTSRFTMAISLAPDAQTWPNSTLSKFFGIDVLGL